MKTKIFFRRLKPVLVLVLAYSFALTAAAQNYYPADVGNTWVLEDAEERRTYSLEGPETFQGTEVITLKIEIEELDTGDLIDTDKYFLTVGSEDIKLHGTILQEAAIGGIVTTNFSTPATFFPLNLTLGDKWQIVADAKVKLDTGLEIVGKSTTNLEVVAFEDLETPAGTFQNCAKIELALTFSTGFINLEATTYQWLAPDIGPVQYQNNDKLISKLVSFNLPTEPEEPEEETTPEPLPYDVTGDGTVNILDLTFVAFHFGESNAEADVNGDGIVNILDLVLITHNFSD